MNDGCSNRLTAVGMKLKIRFWISRQSEKKVQNSWAVFILVFSRKATLPRHRRHSKDWLPEQLYIEENTSSG
jgi:hypothetical protein